MSDTAQTNVDVRYYPMLVIGSDEADTIKALTHIWERYRALPQERKNILVSNELPSQLKKLEDVFHLDESAFENIVIYVRKIFFGELSLAECEAKIGSMLAVTGGGDPNQAKAIVEFIQKEILTIQPKPEEEERVEEIKPQSVTTSMPLLQALSKYENLGNQLITQERIRVKSQAEPVRPSLLYWLKYYRDDIGVGHHDSVQRGQFLFRSENGKRLSAEERERLSLILKSVEEDFPLAIDTERQEIVFPVFSGVTVGGQDQPRALPANAKMTRGPAFVDNGAGDERAKKFIPDRTVATQGAASGLRMGRGMHFSNLEQTKTVSGEPGAISFSANHIFPAEKEKTQQPASVEPVRMPQTPKPASHSVPTPAPAPAPAPKPNPFHIHPVSLGKKK